MSKKVILIATMALLLVAGIIVFPKVSLFMASRKSSCNKEVEEFYIKSFTSLEKLTEDLEYKGIIDDADAFQDVAEYKGMDATNVALESILYSLERSIKTF